MVQALMFYIALVLPALYGSLKCGREAAALWIEVLELQDRIETRKTRIKAGRRKLTTQRRLKRRGEKLDRRKKQKKRKRKQRRKRPQESEGR